MLDFYRRRGPVIFPVTRLAGKLWYSVRHAVRPKYSQAILLRELEAGLYRGKPPAVLRQSQCRLVVPTYHAVAGAPHQFRTPHHRDLTADADTEAAHAHYATTTAPTYFAAAKIENMTSESAYFDGGVWANSPVMAAIVEAVCFLGVPMDRLDVLSVGTTDEPFAARQHFAVVGGVRWLRKEKLIRLLMNAGPKRLRSGSHGTWLAQNGSFALTR